MLFSKMTQVLIIIYTCLLFEQIKCTFFVFPVNEKKVQKSTKKDAGTNYNLYLRLFWKKKVYFLEKKDFALALQLNVSSFASQYLSSVGLTVSPDVECNE